MHIKYKCPVCQMEGSYVPDEDDFKQLEETGIASFSVYHGDHVLVIWFDKDGNIRGHDVFKAVEFRVVGVPEGWKRVNLPRTPQKKLNLLIADRGKKIYSDVFFTGDVNMMLGLVEAVSDRRIISVDEAKYFLIPMGDYVYVIEKNFSEKMLSKIMYLLEKAAEVDLLGRVIPHYILGYALEYVLEHKDFVVLYNTVDIFKHLNDHIIVDKGMLENIEMLDLKSISKDVIEILKNARIESLESFLGRLLTTNKDSLIRFIKEFPKTILVTVILLVGLEFLWLYISLYAVEALGVMEAEWGLLNAVLFPLNALLSSILGKIADKIRLKVSLFMGATLIYLYSLLLAFPLGIGAIYLGGLFVIDIIEEGFLWSSFFKIELELTDKETREKSFRLSNILNGNCASRNSSRNRHYL